ncbi:5-formyltetrahydrofolate cyclo-ligase [Lucilia sericata]|uniref:5-formyltetrahydrofolate cyclo-ligase n=1 Tax=Lucilia sericata TaxID=13632 RepID=UPI0018A869D2|nr:5-formyltetrahydrofolate cyclo-ligase [Lucilia sericata]
MAQNLTNPLKNALRSRMKNEVLKTITAESRARQSKAVTEKVLQTEAFRSAQRISIYLSTSTELDTSDLLSECFRLEKHVFVPTYEGSQMEMVRLKDLQDYETLPLTKWHIKQPNIKDGRENALTNGHGIDLFLIPGVAFTLSGGRMGHGMGYYDKYLKRHQTTYPNKKTTLMALAFREQIVDEESLPLDTHDVRLHTIITE